LPASPKAEPPIAAAKPAEAVASLPGLVKVAEGLASGRKPALEGFDALRKSGYRSVIYLHAPGTDVSAAREVAEARGLKFLAIEVAPETLDAGHARFSNAVGDKANRPIYVFDDDGMRAGTIWYARFRTIEAMNDDAARIRARPLGFPGSGPEADAFSLALQRLLETR
jgi:protein tyrosine phosphatase (PTP) superfamily phosphohydrolase (DUF442 family)